MIILVIEHALSIDPSLLSLDDNLLGMGINGQNICTTDVMLKKFNFFYWQYLNSYSPKYANLVHVPAGIDIRTCGHCVHFKCFQHYMRQNGNVRDFIDNYSC
ncbi:hypothetical protein LOAG_14768 [Loa loa]|uniref:Uncharacterized protein n=1 Tax=Loa loa TaxID=7209 RepID=A0A1S0TH65_LOALO|nr:hypothetical protein LOAG_14768 [Loa loa]EFO13760.1 hypothetical protein LOAG_14768 [Loa loa]